MKKKPMKEVTAAPAPVYWDRLREKLKKREGVTFLWGMSPIPGTFTANVFHEDMPMPLCVVYYNFFGNEGIQINNSFTFEYVRRSGLRTLIHEKMLEAYPDRWILSGAGTESGTAWMKATGYKKTSLGWEFRRKKKN